MTKDSPSARRFSLKNDDLLLKNEANTPFSRQTLPDNLGGYSDIFRLEDDLSYIETRYKPPDYPHFFKLHKRLFPLEFR
jgi:hypothetical protein